MEENRLKVSAVISFRRENADDYLCHHAESDNVENLKYAKRGYAQLQREIEQGYHCPGVSHEECEQNIKSLEKKIRDKS